MGTGKTALMLQLCRHFAGGGGEETERRWENIVAVTNDIFTKEDGEFLAKHEALPIERIRAVETGGCPHAAIREDIGANLSEVDWLRGQIANAEVQRHRAAASGAHGPSAPSGLRQ